MSNSRCGAQVAALPVKQTHGTLSVLLVTSRETRRWIVPKGWPMKGRKDHKAAAQEAREEAGVAGRIHRHPVGAYTYAKRSTNAAEQVRVMVYLLEVDHEAETWPEGEQRTREWMPAAEAAARVADAGLSKIIERLDRVESWRGSQSAG